MIGNIIKQRRIELGMTQGELAKKMGYKSKSTINKIEMGINDVSQTKLKKFAEVLEVSPMLFVEGVPHDPIPSDIESLLMKKFSMLSPEQQDNVIRYIDFLLSEK